ncbi:uncharacterized protein [Watersipora subatra]|uniref:uncharacterized protein n=1 Tax=Watersipora subatra TaxID=2589382 RepID=UPI00355BFF48
MFTLSAFCILSITVGVRANLTPIITSLNGQKYVSDSNDDGFYRSILIDDQSENAYIGAKNSIYKLALSGAETASKVTASSNEESKPNFGAEETQVLTDFDSNSDIYKTVDDYLTKRQPIQLIATEKLSQVYKLRNETFVKQCKRQIQILKMYYGKHLQLPLDDPDMVCAQHNHALTWLNKADGRLFSLRNGIFGTQPVGLTGVTDFESGWPAWLAKSAQLTLPGVTFATYRNNQNAVNQLIYDANRTCYICKYSQSPGDCIYPGIETTRTDLEQICFREYGIPNYMSTNYLCDGTPNPARVISNVGTMEVEREGQLSASEKETCSDTNIASTFLAGYHPDQNSKSITSESGNGVRGGAAVYVLAEIGQEKQLDVNHEAFMGYEEPIPLTSSSSLALVRLLVKDGEDIGSDDILVSNPFKETWVTSPLTKYGRLVKTGNQATVPHRPRAVGLFEDEDYIYFFLREVEWEAMMQPEYSVNRYHFLWKSYDRTISYPWEKEISEEESNIGQFERSDPEMYFRYSFYTELEFSQVKKFRNTHVYEPRMEAFKHGWKNSKITSRVGRVCKNDAGLPLGVQDASVFNLDNKLSLSAFQSFLKTKLTCEVKVNAVPRSWRQRKDMFNFLIEYLIEQRNICSGSPCVTGLCSSNYNASGEPEKGIYCDRNLKGRDVSFRAFLDYTISHLDFINPTGLFQQTVGGFSQYHWAYEKEFATFSSVSYEYTELQDMYKIGDIIYGIFSSPHSDSVSPHSALPKGSAVCQFNMDDIKEAFNGPFKKRLNNAWRPYDPRIEGTPVSPSPYMCGDDPIRPKAEEVMEMEIEFTDETLPLELELSNFDMRGKSSRLNFFEKDVEGSRTMWNSVSAEPIFTSLESQYEKIQVEKVEDVTLLYLATTKGEIHKVASWSREDKGGCWQPNATKLEEWWQKETNLRNNSWGQDYFTLTQESLTEGAEDYLFKSEWDCNKTTEHRILAVYRPFKSDVKIWDMKLAKNKLVIGTDKDVQIVDTAQCDKYLHCSTCSRDPHCGWQPSTMSCLPFQEGLIQGVTTPANCSACLLKKKVYDPGQYIFLDTTLIPKEPDALNRFDWYHNGSLVKEKLGRFVLTRNSSLYIISGRPEDVGVWELRDSTDKTCMITYNLSLSDCQSELCQYEKERLSWCSEHEEWQESMYRWQEDMSQSGCVNIDNT